MAFWHANRNTALFEIILSFFLALSFFFIKKRIFFILIAVFSFSLFIFYGYMFASNTAFFPGIMTAISGFIVFNSIKTYLNI